MNSAVRFADFADDVAMRYRCRIVIDSLFAKKGSVASLKALRYNGEGGELSRVRWELSMKLSTKIIVGFLCFLGLSAGFLAVGTIQSIFTADIPWMSETSTIAINTGVILFVLAMAAMIPCALWITWAVRREWKDEGLL